MIEWPAFEFIPNLEHIDISNNSFVGSVEISYFQNCKNLKYFNVAHNGFLHLMILMNRLLMYTCLN